jgi:hypothetical protein
MPRIPYVQPEMITEAEIRGYPEQACREGTPRPESQAIRAHNPSVIRAFSQAWDLTFQHGVLDHKLKERCRVYVSKSIQYEYVGMPRGEEEAGSLRYMLGIPRPMK